MQVEVAVTHSSALSGLVSQLLHKGYQVGLAYCWKFLLLEAMEESSQTSEWPLLPSFFLNSQFDQPSVTPETTLYKTTRLSSLASFLLYKKGRK